MSNITRYNDPFAGLTSLHSQLDDMFNNFFSQPLVPSGRSLPAVDVYTEDDKQLVTEIQAPGFSKDDLDISVHDGMLEIKGEKRSKDEQKDKKRSYVVRESHASFYRSIALPKQADTENVQASFEDGLLKVTVPFTELPQPKKVAITAGKK